MSKLSKDIRRIKGNNRNIILTIIQGLDIQA
jgi:hypothetical protein